MTTIEPFAILFDVGIGDFFNMESLWPPERKLALRTVWHAWPGSDRSTALIDAMRACPAYTAVNHRALEYPTQQIPGAIHTLRDHAIGHLLDFHGSAFLAGPLDCEVPAGLPDRFVAIQPSTPVNRPETSRHLTDGEWPFVLARLVELDAVGVVLNLPGGPSAVPDHPRLLDWTGRTSLPQSIEVLKRARGYIGVDSNLAILAAQLFAPEMLTVKCNNPYLVDHPWLTYPPQSDYSFLAPRIGLGPHKVRRHRPAPGAGRVVRLACNALVGGRNYGPTARVELEPGRAAEMITAGQAVPVAPEDLA